MCQFLGIMATQPSLVNTFSDDTWVYQQINTKNYYVDDNLLELLNKPWHVFTCTPLCNFKLDKFREKLNNSLTLQGIKFGECSVDLAPEFVVSDEDDPAIKIELFNSSQKKTRIYEGLFLSRASDNKRRQTFINLPVLICKGSLKLVKSVNTVLETLLDNSISPYKFMHNELLILGVLSSLNTTTQLDDDIDLKYDFPDIANTSLKYHIKLKDFVQLWESICKSDDSVSGKNSLGSFYRNLLNNFRRIYGIDLTFFRLKDVVVSKHCIIRSSGIIKTQVPEVMDFLIRYLTKHINLEIQV